MFHNFKLLKDTSDSGVRDASRDMISVLSRISCKGNNTGAASSLVGVNGNEPSRGSCCRYKDNRLILIMNKLQEFFGSSHDRMGDFRGQGDRDSQPDVAVRETMLNSDIPSHVASRNGQGAHTGPIISHMSNEIANEALNFICTLLPDYDFYGICVSWIQQGMSESDDGSTGPARGAVGKCLGYRGDFT
ncbi:unnamed protein product [Arabidopsis lyrata]|nr:unnamed protein product [Arabidopsis lyrata]